MVCGISYKKHRTPVLQKQCAIRMDPDSSSVIKTGSLRPTVPPFYISDRSRGSGGSNDQTQLVSSCPGAAHMWCPGERVGNDNRSFSGFICLSLFYVIAIVFHLYHGGFVCLLLFYTIAIVFHLYHEMRRRNFEPTLLLTQWIFNLQRHISMV